MVLLTVKQELARLKKIAISRFNKDLGFKKKLLCDTTDH